PQIAGIDKANVKDALQTLKAGDQVSGKRVVVLGGGKCGLVAAEYYASQNNRVSIVTSESKVDFDVSPTFKWRHAAWIKEFQIEVHTSATVTRILDGAVEFVGPQGKTTTVEADLVIVAAPRVADKKLFTELEYVVDEIYIVGDALSPRGMHNAIHEGYRVGIRI
ncbi:MAG: FAD-dependent oxidoreductase, partial [Candidatus Methanomethylicaceae archaeon]